MPKKVGEKEEKKSNKQKTNNEMAILNLKTSITTFNLSGIKI